MEHLNLTPETETKLTPVKPLTAPFPYFGGKRRIAAQIWERLGDTPNYVEPFFGSGAVLLARPGGPARYETVNDLDKYLANFWRAVKSDPDAVAQYCDWPINETELEARHYWLVTEGAARLDKILGNHEAYDAKVAGFWVWGMCLWIAGGWCYATGPWQWSDESGWEKRIKVRGGEISASVDEPGINKKIPLVSKNRGIVSNQIPLPLSSPGINRVLPRVREGICLNNQTPFLSSKPGINRVKPKIADFNSGILNRAPPIPTLSDEESRAKFISEWLNKLSNRLRHTRVTCGDWRRILGPAPTTTIGLTSILFDPPYAPAGRASVYNHESDVATDVRTWCHEHGNDPKLRIALCGYAGEHSPLESQGWKSIAWKAKGGYAGLGNGPGKENSFKETVWFSPHCLPLSNVADENAKT